MMIRLAALCFLIFATTPSTGGHTQELANTAAFERAYGTSFYEFDACGDGLTGRLFRRALTDKLAQCPLTPTARSSYAKRTTAMRTRLSATIEGMVDKNGGLPVQLEGMSNTCHEQRNTEAFQHLTEALRQYGGGQRGIDAVIPAKCDDPDILP